MRKYNITFDEGGKNERTMTFRYMPSEQQVQNMSENFAYEMKMKKNFKVKIVDIENGIGQQVNDCLICGGNFSFLERYVYDVEKKRATLKNRCFLHNARYGCPLKEEIGTFKLDATDMELSKNNLGKEATDWNEAKGDLYSYQIAELTKRRP